MKENKIRFSWDIHWACNYRCPYCWWHGRWKELEERNVYPGTDKLVAVWKNIYERYGEVHIEIAGGEPFSYPDFFNFLSGVLRYHTVGVMTNLTGDINDLISGVRKEKLMRLKIGATFHPLFADLKDFLASAAKLREEEFSIGVLYLAYPPQIDKIPNCRKIFTENGINFSISTFWGIYNGKEYPKSYTDEELNIIDSALGNRNGEKFQTTPFKTKGRLCYAGHTYGIIHPDGEVLPCGGGSWRGENIIIGNIFDDDFELWKEPHLCNSEYCPCNEWAFLLKK